MAKRKISISIYLFAIMIILAIAVVYLNYTKLAEVPVVTSDEKAVEIQQDVSTSIGDIKGDLEQLKKSLGK